MFKALGEFLKPFFTPVSRGDTKVSLIIERFGVAILMVMPYFILRCGDLRSTYFLKDKLIWVFPLLMLVGAVWYVMRDLRRYRLNLYFLLCLPFMLVAYCVQETSQDGSILFQIMVAGAAISFLIIHMLRLRQEQYLFLLALSLIALYAALSGVHKFTYHKTWLMANDLIGYYTLPFIRGGFFGSVDELSAFLCALLPFPIAIITARNYEIQEKFFALLLFGGIWTAIARTCNISAIVCACVLLCAAPFMYIGSHRLRRRLLLYYLLFSLATVAIFAYDRHLSFTLAYLDLKGQALEGLKTIAADYAAILQAPLVGPAEAPHDIYVSFARGFYDFGWAGMAAIVLPLLFLLFKMYLHWRTLYIEQWPMGKSLMAMSRKERGAIVGKIRHANLNRSVTPLETLHMGCAICSLAAYGLLTLLTNAVASYSAGIIFMMFAAIAIKISSKEASVRKLPIIPRFLTALLLFGAAFYCVVIPAGKLFGW